MAAGLPTANAVEIEFTAGVWTAVTTRVREVSATKGSDSSAQDTQPGTLTVVLENDDGALTPDNPTSTYYPNLIEGKRIRWRPTKGTTSTRFVGRITQIAPVFPSVPWHSLVTITATDALGDLERMRLGTMLEQYVTRASGASAFWPMRDTNAAAGAREAINNSAAMRVRYVSAGGSADFASVADLGPDDVSFVQLKSGKGLWTTSPAFSVPTSSYVSFDTNLTAWVKVEDGSYGEVLFVGDDRRDRSQNYARVSWTSGSAFQVEVVTAGASAGTATTPTTFDAGWHHILLQPTTDGGLGTGIAVDGVIPGASTVQMASVNLTHVSAGGSVNLGVGPIIMGGQGYEGFMTAPGGTVTTPGIFEDALDLASSSIGIAGLATLALTTSPYPALGRTAFEVLLDIANTDTGVCYAVPSTSATQDIQIVERNNSRPITVGITVDAAADMVGEPEVSRDVYNKASSATASSWTTTATATDSSLVGRYGATEVSVDTIHAETFAQLAVAQDRLANAQNSKTRISSVSVDLSTAANDLYSSAFALTVGSRLRLTNLPSTYFGVTYIDGYITGWTETLTAESYVWTFSLEPADAPPEGRWDDSTYGRWGFGDGVCTNTSSATSSATSVAFQWTGGLTLSTSAGDYPLDLDWNGERITVNSAPGGGSSPQTLSITRGVAPTVARAHNAGESVDLWNAARWAM